MLEFTLFTWSFETTFTKYLDQTHELVHTKMLQNCIKKSLRKEKENNKPTHIPVVTYP